MSKLIGVLFSTVFAAVLSVSAPAVAQEFFKNKTLTFIVGYSAGGSFDLYTRTIARHFNKHVPGNPTIVVENMTGASGLIAVIAKLKEILLPKK